MEKSTDKDKSTTAKTTSTDSATATSGNSTATDTGKKAAAADKNKNTDTRTGTETAAAGKSELGKTASAAATGDKSTKTTSGTSTDSAGMTSTGTDKNTGESKSASTTSTDSSSNSSPQNEDKPLMEFFVSALKDIYYAEHAMVEKLPKMREAATTEELQDAFEDHELLTRRQITRLEKVFREIGEEPAKQKCDAIEGLIKEAEKIIKSTPDGSMTRDAALIIAAQKIEHYEIATYGGLVQLAITLGFDKAVDLLEDTLEEEEETDFELTDIAESFINFEAEEEDSDDDFEDEDDDDEYDEEDDYEDEEDYDESADESW